MELCVGNYATLDGLVNGVDGTFQDYIENNLKPLTWIHFHTLGEKPHFSTMFSTTFQLSFRVENITFNCKTSFQLKNEVVN